MVPSPSDLLHPSPDHVVQSSTAKAAAKRRRNGTTSRGVAHLTPEQLARKRANDREAQRAIRERTKTEIDRLNQEIQNLKNQQPYRDLQMEVREKNAVQAENADIRRRLESVMMLIQPVLHNGGGLNELAAAADRSPLPVVPTYHTTSSGIAATASTSRHNSIHSPADDGRMYGFPGDAPTSHERRWSEQHIEAPVAPEMPYDERLGVDFLLGNTAQRRVVDPHLAPPRPHAHSQDPSIVHFVPICQYAPVMSPYATLCRHVQSTCPLDTLLLDCVTERRAQLASGESADLILGPPYPDFTTFVYPERKLESHPLSKLFVDILRTFPDIDQLADQVAIAFVMFLLTRWMIQPTQENYDRLPDWCTPRATQLFQTHPIWFDYIQWLECVTDWMTLENTDGYRPRLRDKIIMTQPPIPFDSFFIPFTTTISLNWSHEMGACLVPPPKTSLNSLHEAYRKDEQLVMNPMFESYLRNLSNWSLGPAFASAFPAFKDAVRIKV